MNDDIARMMAALDQIEAIVRDAMAKSAVTMEDAVLGAGGSVELARDIGLEWFKRLLTMAKVGV